WYRKKPKRPTAKQVVQFIEREVEVKEESQRSIPLPVNPSIPSLPDHLPSLNQASARPQKKASSFSATSALPVSSPSCSDRKRNKCVACQGSVHAIAKCQPFLDLSPYDRANLVRHRLCTNCLGPHHLRDCHSRGLTKGFRQIANLLTVIRQVTRRLHRHATLPFPLLMPDTSTWKT
ncbi:unnamed protein product, partial [Cyprideis torosa]